MNEVPLLFVLHQHLHGWRWAVMRATVDELLVEPTRRCLNAGFGDTKQDADVNGQLALYSMLSFATSIGVSCPVSNVVLDYDPIADPQAADPADAVQISPQVLQIGGR